MKSNNNKISIPQLSKIVHLLGETLGLVVKNQEGKIYYDKIEKLDCFQQLQEYQIMKI